MRTWKDEKTGIRMCEPDSCDEWLTLLWMVGADYDGCNTVDSLKALVDELVDMSLKAQRCLDEEHSTGSPRLVRSTCDYPPDPFDFVETGEMVEKEPEPKRQTARFARITKSPEAFATFMNEELDRCPPKIAQSDCADNPDCVKCWTDWLNEEVTPDD
jgi:hypothetical protein